MGARALSGQASLRAVDASACAVSVADTADHAPADADLSCGEISPVWNATAFRRSFPERWGQYLRETFGTAYAVQKAFPGIDSKTARDWIGGKRDPSGSFVATVVARDPDAMRILGGDQ